MKPFSPVIFKNCNYRVPSEITTFWLRSQDGTPQIVTIASKKEESNSLRNILYQEQNISRSLIAALKNNKYSLYINENLYLIEAYRETPQLLMLIGKKLAFWVYRLKYPCSSHSAFVKAKPVMVLEKEKKQSFPMLCVHCEKCDKYYINSESFLLYAKKYGIPMVDLKFTSSSDNTYQNWAEESVLHFLGYNVSQTDNLTAKQRQSKLLLAINGDFVSKPKAIVFLEGLIHRHKHNPKYALAVKKWEDDLWFLLNNSTPNSDQYVDCIVPTK